MREEEEIRVYPNPFVRTDWGSFYTPDDLVALVIEEAVGPLADARRKAFREAVSKSASAAELARLDPATKILELKVCELRQPAKLTYQVWRSQRSYDTSVWPVDGFAREGGRDRHDHRWELGRGGVGAETDRRAILVTDPYIMGEAVTEQGLDWLGEEDVISDVPVRNLRRCRFGAVMLM